MSDPASPSLPVTSPAPLLRWYEEEPDPADLDAAEPGWPPPRTTRAWVPVPAALGQRVYVAVRGPFPDDEEQVTFDCRIGAAPLVGTHAELSPDAEVQAASAVLRDWWEVESVSAADARARCEHAAAVLLADPTRWWRSDTHRTLTGAARPGLGELVDQIVGLGRLLPLLEVCARPFGPAAAAAAALDPAAGPTGPEPTGLLPGGRRHTYPDARRHASVTARVLARLELPVPHTSEPANRAAVDSPAFREFEAAMGFTVEEPARRVLAELDPQLTG